MVLSLRRISYALGAEVCEIDVSAPMSEARFGEIYRAFLDQRTTVLGTPSGYAVASA